MSEFIHRDEPALCKVCSDRLYEAWRKRHAPCLACKAEHPCACGGAEQRRRIIEAQAEERLIGDIR